MFMALLKKSFRTDEIGHLGLCHENGMSAGTSASNTVREGCLIELNGSPAMPGLVGGRFVVLNTFPALNK
jgi:hypothetical protein